MAPLACLPPHQRAVLALVLEKGKSFEEIAALLGLEVEAVRHRAHEALSALGPQDGARPAPRHRAAIGNYLLGQDPAQAPETFAYLERSVAGRDWARALTASLEELVAGRLPEIPPDPSEPPPAATPLPASAPPPARAAAAPARPGPEHDEPSRVDVPAPAAAVSRRGGAVLLIGAAALAAAAVAGFLLLRGGGGGHHPAARASTTTTATAPATLAAQIRLTPARGTKGTAFAAVIVKGAQRVVAIAASGFAPTSARRAYAVWLLNSRTDAALVGYVLQVKADGKISAAARIPAGAGRFHELVITRESSTGATAPGTIIFSGPIPAGAAG